jgi:hypothetical protein
MKKIPEVQQPPFFFDTAYLFFSIKRIAFYPHREFCLNTGNNK